MKHRNIVLIFGRWPIDGHKGPPAVCKTPVDLEMFRADSGEVKIADLGVSNEFDGADAFLTSTAGSILIQQF